MPIEQQEIDCTGLASDSGVCEFIGAFIGDGHLSCQDGRHYQIEFAGDMRYDHDYYTQTIVPVINGLVPSANVRFRRVGRNGLRILVASKQLFLLMRAFGFVPGKKTHTVQIPQTLLVDSSATKAVIRGIFDTDGCVHWDKRAVYKQPYPRIVFQTASKPLYDQLVSFLSTRFSLYTAQQKTRRIYVIEIYGRAQLERWMALIGFSNPRHHYKVINLPS